MHNNQVVIESKGGCANLQVHGNTTTVNTHVESDGSSGAVINANPGEHVDILLSAGFSTIADQFALQF
jgi:Fe-S cluster assembly scaffold protein SufB